MRYLLVSIILLANQFIYAQGDKIKTIPIGGNLTNLTGIEWPFDLPFMITGTMEANVLSATFNYKIADPEDFAKKWISFPKKSLCDMSTQYLKQDKEWIRRGDGNFEFMCDGLHPNIKYKFRLTLYRSVSLDKERVDEMRTKIAHRLNAFFKTYATADVDDQAIINESQAITGVILSYFPGKTLLSKMTNQSYTYQVFNENSPSSDPAYSAATDLKSATDEINNKAEDLKDEFNSFKTRILGDIDDIQSGKLKINKYSNEVLKLPFNPGIKDFGSYTLLDGLKILRQMSLPTSKQMENLFEGKVKIVNNSFLPSTEVDNNSLLFIISLLKELSQGVIKDTIGRAETERFGYLKNSSELLSALVTLSFRIPQKIDAELRISKTINLLPDILSQIVQYEALEMDVLPLVDVVSEKTPYISIETGFAYAVPFGAVTNYQCANIYLAPVEKKAPLKYFKGWNKFKKMFSFQLGMSSFFGERPLNTQSVFGNGSNIDLCMGVGLRLSQFFRINTGIIPYKTNNKKELSTSYDLKAAGYVSVGVDINIIKAFGAIGDLFTPKK